MIGAPKNNNTELRSDSTSGDVSEVESGLEVTESEMDDELSKELDDSFDSFISDKKITSYGKEQKSEVSSQQREPVEQLETEKEKLSFKDLYYKYVNLMFDIAYKRVNSIF